METNDWRKLSFRAKWNLAFAAILVNVSVNLAALNFAAIAVESVTGVTVNVPRITNDARGSGRFRGYQ